MLQLRTLVEPSIVVFVGAFAPVIISLAINDAENVWRSASGVLFIGYCLGVGAFISRGTSETLLPSHKVMTAIALAITVALLFSTLGYIAAYEFVYALGLLHSILASVHNFYLLLFPGETEKA